MIDVLSRCEFLPKEGLSCIQSVRPWPLVLAVDGRIKISVTFLLVLKVRRSDLLNQEIKVDSRLVVL